MDDRKDRKKKRKDRLLYWGSLNSRLFIKLIVRMILIILLLLGLRYCWLYSRISYSIVCYRVKDNMLPLIGKRRMSCRATPLHTFFDRLECIRYNIERCLLVGCKRDKLIGRIMDEG